MDIITGRITDVIYIVLWDCPSCGTEIKEYLGGSLRSESISSVCSCCDKFVTLVLKEQAEE